MTKATTRHDTFRRIALPPAMQLGRIATPRRRAALAGMLLACTHAHAQPRPGADPFPTRPVRWIVPFTAGGTADLVPRTLGPRLTESWGHPVVVDNRSGAGGNPGTALVAQAAPDGHTLLLGYIANLAIGPSVYRKLPFDPVKDFAPITQLGSVANILVVTPGIPVKTVKDLVAYARANPGKVHYASASVASPGHLVGELLKLAGGFDMQHVPYKGGSQALLDVISGQVQAMFSSAAVLPHVRSGRMRAIATTGPNRSTTVPDVPTLAESGYPDVVATTWYGALAPARTPPALVARLHQDIVRALTAPEVRKRLEDNGIDIAASTPAEFAAFIRAEIVRWAVAVKASGLERE